jgi:hypothetical protein
MKQQLLITLACLSLAMGACSNKDSYRTASGSGGSGGAGEGTGSSSEQMALDMLAKDDTFSQLSETEESQELKASIQGVEVEVLPMQTENTTVPGMLNMQLTVLDRSSENCTKKEINVPPFREADLINGQVKVNGVGRVVCIDTSDCSDVLLYVESRGEQFSDGNLRQNVVTAITSVRLSKDENGVYRPAQNESDVFANPQTIEQSISKCLAQRKTVSAYQEYAQSRIEGQRQAGTAPVVDSDLAKIQQLTREIQNIEAQVSNNAPTVNNEMRARLTALKSQRADLIRQRQVRAYQQYSQSRREGQAAAQTGGTGTQTVVDPLSGTEFGPQ